MKYLFITPLVLLSLALTVSPVHSMNLLCGFVWLGCETVTKEELFRKDGLYYKKFTDIPFTGNVEVEWQGALKKGKKSGSWVQYWDNGQLMEKGTYVDESPEGFWVRYY